MGIGVQFTVMGLLLLPAAVLGWLYPRLPSLEDQISDAIPDPPEG